MVTGGDFDDNKLCYDYTIPKCAHHVTVDGIAACNDIVQIEPTCNDFCRTNSSINYESDKRHTSSSYQIEGTNNIKDELMNHGSVTAAFTVYEDFLTYKSGVYQHITGDSLGGHAIKIIGWGTEDGVEYWLCVNSWNETWGD